MHVSRSPTARWTSAAATAESTPPDSAQMTLPSEPTSRAWSSTRRRISATVDSMKLAGVQVGRDARRRPTTKLRRTSRPCGVCATSGWNWMPYRCRDVVDEAGERASSRSGRWRWKPSGSAVIESPWLIQTGCVRSSPTNSPSSVADRDRRRAVLALRRRLDVAAELVGHELGAVADAEDGQPAAPDRAGRASGRRRRRPSSGRRTGSPRSTPRRSSSASGVSWGRSSE